MGWFGGMIRAPGANIDARVAASRAAYASTNFLLPSFRLVTMTMMGGFSCQIMRQKSTKVLGRGPEHAHTHIKQMIEK